MTTFLIKADPKAWFAAERTFLHWLSGCVILGSLGWMSSPLIGLLYSTVGLLTASYALGKYRQRIQALLTKEGRIDLFPIWGASVVAAAVSIVFVCGFFSRMTSQF